MIRRGLRVWVGEHFIDSSPAFCFCYHLFQKRTRSVHMITAILPGRRVTDGEEDAMELKWTVCRGVVASKSVYNN